MRNRISQVTRFLSLCGYLVLSFATLASAQPIDIPVINKVRGGGKVMILLDDSNSMDLMMEHPDYIKIKDTFNPGWEYEPPSIIFRVNSSAGDPNGGHTVDILLADETSGVYNSKRTGNPFEVRKLSEAHTHPIVEALNCGPDGCEVGKIWNKILWGGNKDSGPQWPATGANALHYYWSPSITGNALFDINLLNKTNGSYDKDSLGNEFLFAFYRNGVCAVNNYSGGNGYQSEDGSWVGGGTGCKDRRYNRWNKYHALGGEVAFQGKRFTLGKGRYQTKYLSWILYFATQEQLNFLPTMTRMDAAKQAIKTLINENPAIEFAFDGLNRTRRNPDTTKGSMWEHVFIDGPIHWNNSTFVPFGKTKEELLEMIDLVLPRAETPIVTRYVESLEYFRSGAAGAPSPITSNCLSHNIIVVTDGIPEGEKPVKLFGSWIGDEDKDKEEKGNNSGCSNADCAKYGDDAAYVAFHKDFNTELEGTQNVRTGVIGFGVTYGLLDQMAEDGGTGASLLADNTEQLTKAFQDLLDDLLVSAVSGGAVQLTESYGSNGRIYRPRYSALGWRGYVDALEANTKTGSLTRLYEFSDVLEKREEPRKILAGVDSDLDGTTSTSALFTEKNADEFTEHLFQLYTEDVYDKNEDLEAPLRPAGSAQGAKALIRYIRGEAIEGLRRRDGENNGGLADMGDIVYSSIVEVGAVNGAYFQYEGYDKWVEQSQSEPEILLFGSNDGMLHAARASDGVELWAYIPSSLLKHLELLSRLRYNSRHRRPYVDGQITVSDVYIGDSWRTIAAFGLRGGGSSYVVLDISNRESPTLLYEFSDEARLGESWSKPSIFPVKKAGDLSETDPESYEWFLAVSSGEKRTQAGSHIAVVNLTASYSGLNFVTVDASTQKTERATGVSAVQNDKDLGVDRLYVATEAGHVYRIQVPDNDVTNWTSKRVLVGDKDHPITAEPLALLADNPQYDPLKKEGAPSHRYAVGVYWGTGRYDTLDDRELVASTLSQRIVGIFDPVDIDQDKYNDAALDIKLSQLVKQSGSSVVMERGVDGVYRINSGKRGFYLDLVDSLVLTKNFLEPAGMVVAQPYNFRGMLLFASFLPRVREGAGSCSGLGHALLNGVNFRTGAGGIIDTKSGEEPFINSGIFDLDESGGIDSGDLQSGIKSGHFLPLLDAKIESVDMEDIKPYIHSGTITITDIRLGSQGAILPSVTSLGDTGLPSKPSILLSPGLVVVQTSVVDGQPKVGDIDSDTDPEVPGDGGEEDDEDPVEDAMTPATTPIEVFNRGAHLLSFHEISAK